MIPEPPVVVRIPRTGKRMTVSEQTQRDSARILERVRRNEQSMRIIEDVLARVVAKRKKRDLLPLAEECVRASCGRLAIDRLARRNRRALICWFCENWGTVSEFLLQPHLGTVAQGATAAPEKPAPVNTE
jgi:hypothetical protein